MSDNELIVFAENESQKLTIESFHLLKSEFEKRKLDLRVIEIVEIDKALSELNKHSKFEEITAIEFTETIWNYALDEKVKGLSDHLIFNGLLGKGVAEDYAFMLVSSLEKKSKDLIEELGMEMIIGVILMLAGAILFFLVLNDTLSGLFILYGGVAVLVGLARFIMSTRRRDKFKTIINNIERENLDKHLDDSTGCC
ncbi:MAG: hypothetical protein ABIQ56_01935 [Chitinophagaceae bacterium]